MLKNLSLIFVLLAAALLQMSFVGYISIFGAVPNLLFIAFFIIIFLEKQDEYYRGFLEVITAGFLLDVVTASYFGIAITALLAVYLFKKAVFYFIRDIQDAYLILYFLPLFISSLLVYDAIVYGFSLLLDFNMSFSWVWMVALWYNAIVATVMFYLYQATYRETSSNQLSLFQ